MILKILKQVESNLNLLIIYIYVVNHGHKTLLLAICSQFLASEAVILPVLLLAAIRAVAGDTTALKELII